MYITLTACLTLFAAAQEVFAIGRVYRELSQTRMQLALRSWLQQGKHANNLHADDIILKADTSAEELDEWIMSNLVDTEQRRRYVGQLVAHAQQFAYGFAERMETL